MQDDELDVQFIPKDAAQANLIIRNKTDKPLSIKLPEAFAAVHVLAQFGGGGGGLGGGVVDLVVAAAEWAAAAVAVAGPRGWWRWWWRRIGRWWRWTGGGGGGFGGGGAFNLAPEKVHKIKVQTVCLEHGKPDPKPTMKYEIRPIDKLAANEDVR